MSQKPKEEDSVIPKKEIYKGYGHDYSDKILSFILCIVFLSFALIVGIVSSKPFIWPFNWDSLRDIGIAQTILDKTYPEDPILADEINWYNPLTGAIIAFCSPILHLSLPETVMRIGPFLQLLLPIGMILLAWNRWGPWSGFFILAYSLFARHPFLCPEWLYACYSPWLLATHWGKSFLFLTMLMFVLYVEKKRSIYALFTGIFLGLGFLVHTAVLIEAGLFITLYSLFIGWRQYASSDTKSIYNLFLGVVSILLLTLIISIPYWAPILYKYHFIIRNPYPSLFVTTALEWKNLPTTLSRSLNGFTGLGVVSLFFLFLHWKKGEIIWLKVWTLVVILLVLQQFASQLLHSLRYLFPSFFPPHHTFMSAHALVGFWFVYGISEVVKNITLAITSLNANRWLSKGVYIFCLSLIFLFCVNTVPRPIPPIHEIYRGMEENKLVYEVAKYDNAYKWILNNTSHHDTFLCDETTGIWIVMPSARKLIYTMMFYMNPYVDIQRRHSLQNYLWNALEEERFSDFITLCATNRIQYILIQSQDEKKKLLDKITKLSLCYHDTAVAVYKFKDK